MLVGSITYNQPQENKKLENNKETINQEKLEESFVQQVTAKAIKYQEAREAAEAGLNSLNTYLDEFQKNVSQLGDGN